MNEPVLCIARLLASLQGRGIEVQRHERLARPLFAPTGATSSSPGLPLRLPWVIGGLESSNRNAVVSFTLDFTDGTDTTALRLIIILSFNTQGSRSGNPGLDGAAPLGQRSSLTLPQQSVLICPTNVDNNPNTNLLRSSLEQHLEAIRALLDSKLDDIEQSGLMILKTLEAGNKVLLCGNGGSAADAQHIAAELVGRYERRRRAFPAIALTTDTSALTAISNDYGYEGVFARQVDALAVRGDVLIAISTSGKSENVIKAVEQARAAGCKSIALTGCAGEPLASKCDIGVVVPSDRTSRVQEAHITIGHLWCEMIDAASG